MGRQTNRRAFLRQLVLGSEDVIHDPGRHTLVCVFLRGGADTLNMIVPCGDDRYYAVRPTIAIPPPKKGIADGALRLNDFYGFHPKMSPLLPIFADGRLGIVQGVGSDNTSGSHFEAQDQMEHGEAAGRTVSGGWLGRHMQCRTHAAQTPLSAVAIGPAIPESLRGAPIVSAITSIDDIQLESPCQDAKNVARVLSALYGGEVGVLSKPGRSTLSLLERVEKLRTKHYRPEGGAQYPDSSFGSGLREIARLIKAKVGLEVATVDLDGWDTHFVQGGANGLQAASIEQLSHGLAAFDADLVRHRARFTVIVVTEFGRRIYENGSLGTDHGRGFAAIAIGEKVRGGTVHGDWPGLDEDVREGVLGPEGLKIGIDYRCVLAEILSGAIGNDKLQAVFPGLRQQSVGLIKGAVVPLA